MNAVATQPRHGFLDAMAAPSCEWCDAVADTVDAIADLGQTAVGPSVAVEVLDAVLVHRGAGVEIDVQWCSQRSRMRAEQPRATTREARTASCRWV